MLTAKKRKIIFWASIIAFIVLMPLVILYALGFRFDESWNLRKTGGLYITSEVTGSSIYIDDRLIRTTNLLQNAAFVDNLTPGTYKIFISATGYNSWEKILEVGPQLVTEAKALLIPGGNNTRVLVQGNFIKLHASPFNNLLLFSEDKNGEKIVRWYTPENQEFLTDTGSLVKYKKTFELIRWLPQGAVFKIDEVPVRMRFNFETKTASKAPLGGEPIEKIPAELNQENNRIDEREEIKIEGDQNSGTIKAIWLRNTIRPYYFSSMEEILIEGKKLRNFEFYPGRRDAVLAAYDNSISAIEIDSRGGRIIQPLYKGREPEFGITPGKNRIYILDAGNLISVSLTLEE